MGECGSVVCNKQATIRVRIGTKEGCRSLETQYCDECMSFKEEYLPNTLTITILEQETPIHG